MKFMTCAVVALLLLQGKQRDPDKTKGQNPQQILSKAVAAMQKLKGFHFKMDVKSPRATAVYEGIQKGEGSAARSDPQEIFARQTQYLVKTASGKIVPGNELDLNSEDGRKAAGFRNPSQMLRDLQQCASLSPTVKGDEKVGDVDCKVIAVGMSVPMKKEAFKEMMNRVKAPVKVDPDPFVDFEKTVCDYTVYVGKTDLRIHRLTFKMVGESKGNLPPILPPQYGPDSWKAEMTLDLSKFDQNLDWKIPPEVRGKLGLQ